MNFRILARIIDFEYEAMAKVTWTRLLISLGNWGPEQEINFPEVTQLVGSVGAGSKADFQGTFGFSVSASS